MKKAVVLFSGGLDSATTLCFAHSIGFHEIYCLSFNYKQRHLIELDVAKNFIKDLPYVKGHKIISIDMRTFGSSALTDDIDVPKNRKTDIVNEIPITYVPARNTIFLSYALAYAEVLDSQNIFIGANIIDYSGYPDCRPEYLKAFEDMANLATASAVSGKKININAPLIKLTKSEIITLGIELGIDYSKTHSCYDPTQEGRACGECDSCLIRNTAFEKLGLHAR